MSSSKIQLSDNSDLDRFDTLVCIDGSYVIYHTLYSAVNKWIAESPFADVIDGVDTTDENFQQVDITLYEDFNDTAKGKLIETLQKITYMVKDFNNVYMSKTFGQMLFVLDPEHGKQHRSWRFLIYPEYKGQRASANDKKAFNVHKVFDKMVELLREDGFFERRFNMRIVSADSAEADDIIATVFTDDSTKDFRKYLIASDKDYLQLNDVTQMNLEGKQVEIEQPYPDLIKLTPDTYLLAKIITGDTSDNITQVFNRVGYKTAVKKFVANPDYLTESLDSDEVALEKFNRNSRLIDFGRIPKKIRAIAMKAVAL